MAITFAADSSFSANKRAPHRSLIRLKRKNDKKINKEMTKRRWKTTKNKR